MARKKRQPKKYIFLDQLICKLDESTITEKDMQKLTDEIMLVIEKQGFSVGGSFGLMTEQEALDR